MTFEEREEILEQLNDRYFELLQKEQNETLTKKEKVEMVGILEQKVNFIQEDFTVAIKDSDFQEEIPYLINGVTMISNLKHALIITEGNPTRENFEQFAFDFDRIEEYQEAIVTYQETKDTSCLEDLSELYEDGIEIVDAYQKKKK